ncbi:MAG: hypothetical protein NTX87_07685 [Planctomycetota bacterium]|nr:hypothetical protein [Planctomycetota bacterium]
MAGRVSGNGYRPLGGDAFLSNLGRLPDRPRKRKQYGVPRYPYEKARSDWNKKLADEKKKAQGEN